MNPIPSCPPLTNCSLVWTQYPVSNPADIFVPLFLGIAIVVCAVIAFCILVPEPKK